MSDPKFHRGRPVHGEAVDALLDHLEEWPIPDVKEDLSGLSGRSTAMGTPLEELYTKTERNVEPEAVEPEIPTLTLEELEQIRQDAYEEGLKQGHEQGYLEGFEKGAKEGNEAGQKEGLEIGKQQGLEDAKPLVEERLQTLTQLIEKIHEPLKQVDDACEKQLIELVSLLTQQITFHEIKTNPELILQALKKGLDALPIGEVQLKVHLHPDDLSLVEEAYGADMIQKQQWQLIPEPTFERGGCEIKSLISSIDLTVKTRLTEILEKFLHDSGI
ncbi:flagellar assembly protein FliH [Pseudoalteromonas luteoviolacea]|uniref:flagellar assembly protein FliH n=1 Tax=Pseudoalteromonas luteoviolacea TaxID=43657 RepID=UPI001F2F7412|nr:flagellar assembly protein FliH [Pseudoalteromonas luteoviolacea]MCF6440381.1 flagellar assembly protein FliH [Pseudoalteromonas luteoviolacea]